MSAVHCTNNEEEINVLFLQMMSFLGAFAKLWKATISLVFTVSRSVHVKQLVFHSADFGEI
jgi:hypothetical protein